MRFEIMLAQRTALLAMKVQDIVTILNLDLINPRLSLGLDLVIELRTTEIELSTRLLMLSSLRNSGHTILDF